MVKISTKTKKIVAIIIVVLCVITIASELTIEMINNKAKIKAEEEIKKSLAKGDDNDNNLKENEENKKTEEKTNDISKDDSNKPKEIEKPNKTEENSLYRTLPIYKVYASSVLEDGTGAVSYTHLTLPTNWSRL